MCDKTSEEEIVGELELVEGKSTPNVISLNKGPGGVEITVQSSNSSIYEIEYIIHILMYKYGDHDEMPEVWVKDNSD